MADGCGGQHTGEGAGMVFESLKTRQREIRESFPPDFALRIHRAISWAGRAEREADDPDAAFVFWWVAFNAAYANDLGEGEARAEFKDFFARLHALDHDGRLYNAVWTTFSGRIRVFLENPYVYSPFWKHHNGNPDYADWSDRFRRAKRVFHAGLVGKDTALILSMLFDRLYVLRNQILHGGATWNSRVNRDQIRDAAAILGTMVPIMLDLMMDNPHKDWGRPFYPVVEA